MAVQPNWIDADSAGGEEVFGPEVFPQIGQGRLAFALDDGDDGVLIAGTPEELQSFVDRLQTTLTARKP